MSHVRPAFFFFQAEDGIRDLTVTGVQTCALPISVPFQIWTPDVYQGAPAPVTAFLSVGPKAAAFAAVLRIFLGGFALRRMDFSVVWITFAVLTMSLGQLAALMQSNGKKLLAYSAIAHDG